METQDTPRSAPADAHSVGSSALLGIWWHSMPQWAKDAYYNCPTVNRVMRECSMLEATREEMQWRVAEALFLERNQWKETVIKNEQSKPIVVMMPNSRICEIDKPKTNS